MHLTMLELRSSMPFKKIENLFKLQLKFIRVGAKVLWAGALSRLSMYGLSCHPTSWIITTISAFLDLTSFHMGWGDIKREVLMFTSAGSANQNFLYDRNASTPICYSYVFWSWGANMSLDHLNYPQGQVNYPSHMRRPIVGVNHRVWS